MSELKSLRGAHYDVPVCTATSRCAKKLQGCQSRKHAHQFAAGDDESRVVDVWMLLVLHTLGGSHSKAAGALVKKRMTDGSFSRELLSRAIVGHQVRSPDCGKELQKARSDAVQHC